MKKIFPSLLTLILGLIITPSSVQAALIDINSQGTVTLNVLSASTDLKITKIANADVSAGSKITLSKNLDKLELKVESKTGSKSLDVTKLDQELIEVEQFVAPQTIKVQAQAEHFELLQEGVVAKTNFPIQVNTETKKILVETDSGFEFLNTLPLDAINSLEILDVINKFNPENTITIAQNADGQLSYIAIGEKIIPIFNIFELSIPVEAELSVATGKITSIESPLWYKIFGFLLV